MYVFNDAWLSRFSEWLKGTQEMANILQFLSKKFLYIKHGCFQFGQLGQHFLVSRTQEKLRLTTKMQPVKKVKEQWKVF